MSRCGDTRPAGGGPRWGPGLSRSRAQSHWFSPAGRNGAAVSGVPLGTRQGPSETFYQAPRGDAFSSDLASRDDVLRVSGSVLLVDSHLAGLAHHSSFERTRPPTRGTMHLHPLLRCLVRKWQGYARRARRLWFRQRWRSRLRLTDQACIVLARALTARRLGLRIELFSLQRTGRLPTLDVGL